MRSFLTVVVGFLLALSVLPLAHSEVGSRVALVIGNGAYQSVPKLRSPVDDAQAIDRALTALGFRVIRLENATKEQMEGAILELSRQLRPGATSLVYYSGYGINVDGRNYLLPVNAEITTPESLAIQAIGVDEVIAQISRAHTSTNIIVLDACRANPLALNASVMNDFPRLSSGRAIDKSFRSISGGLASITTPAGILIALPTTPGKITADSGGEQGLYATELIRAIGMPGASIETVFKETRLGVIAQSSGTQIPWESSSLTADFSFWPNAASASTTIPTWVPRPAAVVPKLPPPAAITARVQQVAQQEGIADIPSLVFNEATTPPEYQSLLGPWGPSTWKSGIKNKIILIFLGINVVGNGHVLYCSSIGPNFPARCEPNVARVINGKIMFSNTLYGTPIVHEYELGDDGSLHGVRRGRDTIVLPPLR